jgi:hypothetical protein
MGHASKLIQLMMERASKLTQLMMERASKLTQLLMAADGACNTQTASPACC